MNKRWSGTRGSSASYGGVSGSALAGNGNLNEANGLLDELALWEQCENLEHRYSKQNTQDTWE